MFADSNDLADTFMASDEGSDARDGPIVLLNVEILKTVRLKQIFEIAEPYLCGRHRCVAF